MSTKFRTVQSIAPFVAGWFFVFNLSRPDDTTDEAFVEFAKSEVPDAKHLLGHDGTIYCFVPTAISLEEIKAILDNQDVLPGTAKLFYLTSMSNFNDMLRVLDKSASRMKKRTDVVKCGCGISRKSSAAGDTQEDLEALKKVSSAAMRAIDAIPRNEKTKPIVVNFLVNIMSDTDNLSVDTFRKFRTDLVGAIGEEAVVTAGFPPID